MCVRAIPKGSTKTTSGEIHQAGGEKSMSQTAGRISAEAFRAGRRNDTRRGVKTIARRTAAAALASALIAGMSLEALAGPGGAPGASSSSSVTYSGATTITAATSESGKTYSSTTADQSALLINTTGAVSVTNPTVTKTGDSDGGDNCNFYGQNAAVLAMGGTTTTITGGTVKSSATGANGVFSYGGNGGTNGAAGDGTTVNISGTTITTTGSGSGGIMTTGGGVTNATNLTVTTSGGSSAPIRTDRGGGTVNVSGGTYTANGLGSPAIYSTAAVTAKNATLISNLSEGVCIEGKNSITLNNCSLTASNTKRNGNAQFLDTIMIYQSMSGDADSGTSAFTMTNGSLTSKKGHVFHVTNTTAEINLSNVTITNSDSDNVLLSVCDDGWSGGSNIATLNASNQDLSGTILVGSDSTLDISLASGSAFTGAVSGSIANASGTTVSTSAGTTAVTLDSTSSWTLSADSYVTSISGTTSNINTNGHTLYVNGTAWSSSSGTTDSTTSTTDSTTSTTDTTGSDTESVTISRKPVIRKLTAKKRQVKVTWKKIKRNKKGKALLRKISYIQIQYSTSSKFTAGTTVTKTVKKTKTSVSLKGLSRKTRYYVRMRYVGSTGVSKWSKIKKVRTK